MGQRGELSHKPVSLVAFIHMMMQSVWGDDDDRYDDEEDHYNDTHICTNSCARTHTHTHTHTSPLTSFAGTPMYRGPAWAYQQIIPI